jgi:MoxR-like ATPase
MRRVIKNSCKKGKIMTSTTSPKRLVEGCMERIATRVVGQNDLVKKVLLALVSGGHVLVEGVPGIAKTLLISTVAQLIGLPFKRIQFTPDLLPSDLTGMSIFNPKEGKFVIEQGPVFTNIVLADEINRAPPKVQSALLEVMAEKQVTIFGTTLSVKPPFFVMATQNPIEQEGTYPLPEAQLDRFMMKLIAPYPTAEEEKKIATQSMIHLVPAPVSPALSLAELTRMQQNVEAITIHEKIIDYIVEIVVSTRDPAKQTALKLNHAIQWGASPRATLWMIRGAKTLALIEGRDFVTPHDVKEIAKEVLRHRLVLSYEAQADGMTADTIVDRLLKEIPSP